MDDVDTSNPQWRLTQLLIVEKMRAFRVRYAAGEKAEDLKPEVFQTLNSVVGILGFETLSVEDVDGYIEVRFKKKER